VSQTGGSLGMGGSMAEGGSTNTSGTTTNKSSGGCSLTSGDSDRSAPVSLLLVLGIFIAGRRKRDRK
jgi:MYXO-CTERM domain-containing protein